MIKQNFRGVPVDFEAFLHDLAQWDAIVDQLQKKVSSLEARVNELELLLEKLLEGKDAEKGTHGENR